LIGVVLLGFIYAIFHEPMSILNFTLTGLQWLVVALFLGILGGLFFHWIVRESGSEFETVLIILGIVVYVGGLAYYLNLSALFVAFIIGIVMANVSPSPERVSQILATTEKPFYIVFLIFAGALWNFQFWILFLIAPVVFGIRVIAKLISTWASLRLNETYQKEYWGTGLGLSSLAGLALAIALEFYLMKPAESSTWLLGMVILLILLNQIGAPIIFRFVLPKLRQR
jgi:Kef-type K+ transport system membrane component KefB